MVRPEALAPLKVLPGSANLGGTGADIVTVVRFGLPEKAPPAMYLSPDPNVIEVNPASLKALPPM